MMIGDEGRRKYCACCNELRLTATTYNLRILQIIYCYCYTDRYGSRSEPGWKRGARSEPNNDGDGGGGI
jgi:hypothetical protein